MERTRACHRAGRQNLQKRKIPGCHNIPQKEFQGRTIDDPAQDANADEQQPNDQIDKK